MGVSSQTVQSKLERYENREPRLELYVLNSHKSKQAVFKVPKLPEPTNYNELIEGKRKSLEDTYIDTTTSARTKPKNNPFGIEAAAFSLQHQLRGPLKTKEEYDAECERYLKNYRHFLMENDIHARYLARYRTLGFVVTNSGTQPAEDITIIIDFPDEFHFPIGDEEEELVITSSKAPTEPEAPNPFRPGPLDIMKQNQSLILPPILADFDRYVLPDTKSTGPIIKPKNSTEVSYLREKLVHNFSEELDAVGFFITEAAIGRTFELNYSIHASELLQPVDGIITIKVETLE